MGNISKRRLDLSGQLPFKEIMSNNMIFIFHSNEQGRPILKNLNFLARKKGRKESGGGFWS
jgi:hypothetical protein